MNVRGENTRLKRSMVIIIAVIVVMILGVLIRNIMTMASENRYDDTSIETIGDYNSLGYTLVWEDDFNDVQLSREDWNVELHKPGWVNAELQEYVDSDNNIYIEDGNLIIQPIEIVGEEGDKYYTSGRVNTKDKHDFKYGLFEARLKVPKGMGFLPAFWMMPTEENFYGSWPRCGEIDIMEVMGQSTNTLHGTIHYGNPHGQKQGTYIIDKKQPDFAEDYHTYACEWEPGKITWYVDGIKFHEATDWYTKLEGSEPALYPAPFNQPFYIILNVAVGGSWVGYPDKTTRFGDNAQMVVDYVRVYQKAEYNEKNYIRYGGDQTIALNKTKQTFSYEFDMKNEDDTNSRFEITLGALESKATVYIDNIKVEKIGEYQIKKY